MNFASDYIYEYKNLFLRRKRLYLVFDTINGVPIPSTLLTPAPWFIFQEKSEVEKNVRSVEVSYSKEAQ